MLMQYMPVVNIASYMWRVSFNVHNYVDEFRKQFNYLHR